MWKDHEIREWSEAAAEARKRKLETGEDTQFGWVFGICVEKNHELPAGDPRRKYKYRVVFQGNRVVNQSWADATFLDMGSAPALLDAARACLRPNHRQ